MTRHDLLHGRTGAGARWIAIARRYADALLRYGTDRYGPDHTPMWVQMIDLRTLEIPVQETAAQWEQETSSWEEDRGYDRWITSKHGLLFAGMSNLNWDGSNVRLMNALTNLTGEMRYREAARAYLDEFFRRCVSPETGLFAWGLHMAYDVRKDMPALRWHELGMWDPPPWEEMLDANPDKAVGGIRAIYDWHVHDKRTYAFDRKAEFFSRAYTHETFAFWHHVPMYVEAFLAAWRKTRDPEFRRWSEEFLTSIWAKRNRESDLFPGGWCQELERYGEIRTYDRHSWPMEYLLRAYEACGERYLLDIAVAYLLAKGTRSPIGTTWEAPREARVALKASRLAREPILSDLATAYADALPEGITTSLMAFEAGHTLMLFLDLLESTGDERWFRRAEDYARRAEALFVHESGLITGAAGLKRPLYYDAAHGPGVLATAFYRLGLAGCGCDPCGILVCGSDGLPHSEPGGFPAIELPATVTCKFLGHPVRRATLVAEDGVASGTILRIEGVDLHNVWRFTIPREPFSTRREIRFRIVPDGLDAGPSSAWHYLRLGMAAEPPVVGDPDVTRPVVAGGDVPVSVKMSDPDRARGVFLRYLLDDKFGYQPVPLARGGDGFTGLLSLPGDEIPRRVTLAAYSEDELDEGRVIYSRWETLRICTSDTLTLGEGTSARYTGVRLTAARGAADATVRVNRYWWWPREKGTPPKLPTSEDSYEIVGADLAPGPKTISFAFDPEAVARFLPSSLVLLHRAKDDWQSVSTEVDGEQGRLTCRSDWLDGMWAITGRDRLIWSVGVPENNCAMFLDVDGDGVAEVVSGGGGHRVFALAPDGRALWDVPLGTPHHPSGGTFSHVAGFHLPADSLPRIVIGSVDGSAYCFDGSGVQLWRYVARDEVRSGVALLDADVAASVRVAFADISGHVHLLDADGNRLWERKIADECFATPAFADVNGDGVPELLCGTRGGDLVVIGLDGDPLWTRHLGGQVGTPAIGPFHVAASDVERPAILAGTSLGTLAAFDPQGGLLWEVETPKPAIEGWNEPDVTMSDLDGDGVREVVMASKNHTLHAFDSSGRERWSFATGDQIVGGVAYAGLGLGDGWDIIVASTDGTLYALDGNGTLRWFFRQRGLDWFTHCLVGDVNGDGLLEVFLKTGSSNCLLRTESSCEPHARPWMTYRGNLRRTGVV